MGGRVAAIRFGVALALACTGLTAAAAAPAAASSNTNISSFADPRGDLPNHPGQLVRARYGPFTIPAATSPSQPGQLHNVPTTETPPCVNCRITDMIPNLVFSDGTTANMQDEILLHHFVLFNPANQSLACPITEPFFGAGNERTHLHLPSPWGYENTSPNWSMLTHLVNLKSQAQTVNVEVVYRWRPMGETERSRPLWLDVDGCGGDSEYTIPTGYSDTHVDWTSTLDARVLDIAGHLHDIDIIDPNPCITHCPERGGGVALSAEVIGGPAADYFGPLPPNNPPPSDITGATLCRSEAYYGTAYGTANRFAGHLDTMSHCGIFSELPGGAQALAYPASGAYPADGYPIKKGQVLRLHSEYQNGSGMPKTDVMGIMQAWLALPNPYPRPKSATPMYLPLVPAFAACSAGNRVHAPPLPSASCSPAALASGQLTVGTPDSNSTAANSSGYVRMTAIVGNSATTADEADVRMTVSVVDVRRKSDLADYTGQLDLRPTLRITDRNNGPGETGTGQDTTFPVTVPCGTTPETTIGATCAVTTTADTVLPGTVKEDRRSIWEVRQVQVFDGGPDSVAATAPNTLYMVQGSFAP